MNHNMRKMFTEEQIRKLGTKLYKHALTIGRIGNSPIVGNIINSDNSTYSLSNIPDANHQNIGFELPCLLLFGLPYPGATFYSFKRFNENGVFESSTVNISDVSSITDVVTPL